MKSIIDLLLNDPSSRDDVSIETFAIEETSAGFPWIDGFVLEEA